MIMMKMMMMMIPMIWTDDIDADDDLLMVTDVVP